MPSVYNIYAEAFFKLSLQENALNENQNDLIFVTDLYKAEPKFRGFLLDPETKKSDKKQAIINVFAGKISNHTLHFMMLLLDKSRINFLPEICTEFVKISDKHRNILSITITTATGLDQEQIELICETFKTRFKAEGARVTVKIDPAVIGGIKVVVGDKLFDATVKEALSGLRRALTV